MRAYPGGGVTSGKAVWMRTVAAYPSRAASYAAKHWFGGWGSPQLAGGYPPLLWAT